MSAIKRIPYILFTTALIYVSTCINTFEHSVENWEVGVSAMLFDELSQEKFNELERNGIKYIELGGGIAIDGSDEEIKRWVSDIKEKAEKAGIEIWSIHLPYSKTLDISSNNQEDREYIIQRHIRLMALSEPLKVRKYVIHPSACTVEDDERSARIENSISSLKILSDEVKKYEARLAMEVLPRTCLGNTSDEVLQIVHAVGNELEVCFDSNHLLQETPEEFVAKVGEAITTTHISDYDRVDEKHWLPGTGGIIDWNKVIAELVNAGYEGPWMYEVPKAGGRGRNENHTVEDLAINWQGLKNDYLDSVDE